MKVNDDLAVIELPMSFGAHTSILNVSLIFDPEQGVMLVDTGLPGQEKQIEEALAKDGASMADLKRILLTHQDLDHVGSLAALKQQTGATTMASEIETPYIQGELRGYKIPPPERLEQMPEFKRMLEAHRPTHIDEQLQDGQRLDIAGGVKVVATPGHTPGHIGLYLERTKTLITGDALTSENGTLKGPNPGATPDMETAMKSVKKLAELDVETIVCYHGGMVTENANDQLKRVAAG
ncbi:MAG TPA: MBL fold metallo-hydrolase [Fimbriimonas sp.]|nr:MBL fold metallo-hydrolase [Fimbriimonas sp.]